MQDKDVTSTASMAPNPTRSSTAGASALATVTAGVDAAHAAPPPGFGYRWTIVALLFFATTINYIDRQVFGILAPVLQDEIG
jgi:ACS family hexuronate transporter-like MFS transporter